MDWLFSIVIYPLKFILEFSFSLFYHIFKNSGIAVLGVSLAVTLMCLPLYLVAETWQERERAIQEKLKFGIDRIKRAFKGDEQYMILTTFYRQNNYHPLMALRSSFSLLIQIPFFMAAYSYLSHLSILDGESFFFIKNMGKPDELFKIGSFSINFLPILMTIINCASGFIYTKGHSIREKIQIYGMACLFLFILYDSPSGLVLYWTMNQVFSLLKNIFFKFKNPKKVLYICLAIAVLIVDFYCLFIHHGRIKKRLILICAASILLFIPFFIKMVNFLYEKILYKLNQNTKVCFSIFLISAITLTLLNGFIIPESVISSSVIEFTNIDGVKNPINFVFNTLFQSIGLFLFWPTCLYFLFGKKFKAIIAFLMLIATFISLENIFIFVGNYGTLTRLITFNNSITNATSNSAILLNLGINFATVLIICCLIIFNLTNIISGALSIVLLTSFVAGITYTTKIRKDYASISINFSDSKETIEPFYHLSKTNKNVVVFMVDRAESSFFDSIFEEDTSLKEIYSGFTLYPNTISYGGHTIIGAPPIYGGYEYTPLEFNKRNTVKNIIKHNESILVMPRIFNEQAGYDATITDSSWANYNYYADMSFVNEYPNIKAGNVQCKYTALWLKNNKDKISNNFLKNTINRNMLWLSIFRSSPYIFRNIIYDDGLWWSSDTATSDVQEFIDYYAPLDYLRELTDFSANNNTFTCITNDSTHSNIDLQPPEYTPATKITQKGTGKYSEIGGYDTCIAMFKLIGRWIVYLKENKAYDNTRIIIVSDHGIGKDIFNSEYSGTFESDFDRDHLHPLLFVKDFNTNGPIKKDYTFMTNADVPLLALSQIVDKPINPFTKKELTDYIKKTQGAVVTTNSFWSPDQHNSTTFKITDDSWFTVKDNIFESDNWKKGRPE